MIGLMSVGADHYSICKWCGRIAKESSRRVHSGTGSNFSYNCDYRELHDDTRFLLPPEVRSRALEVFAMPEPEWAEAGTSPDNPPVSVVLSEADWKAVVSILHNTCMLKGYEWLKWEQFVSQTIQTAVVQAQPPQTPPMTSERHSLGGSTTGVWCPNSGHSEMIWIAKERVNNCVTDYYLCLYCGMVLMCTDFGEDFESDASLLSGALKEKAIQIIQSDPLSKKRLLEPDQPYRLRSRAARGNPKRFTEDELGDMAEGQRLLRLEEGEWTEDDLY